MKAFVQMFQTLEENIALKIKFSKRRSDLIDGVDFLNKLDELLNFEKSGNKNAFLLILLETAMVIYMYTVRQVVCDSYSGVSN